MGMYETIAPAVAMSRQVDAPPRPCPITTSTYVENHVVIKVSGALVPEDITDLTRMARDNVGDQTTELVIDLTAVESITDDAETQLSNIAAEVPGPLRVTVRR